MIFVDTGGWVGYISPDDDYHAQANTWMRSNRQILVTTDYVLDESLTLLKARGEPMRAQQLGALLFGDFGSTSTSASAFPHTSAGSSTVPSSGSMMRLYYLMPEDILEAWQVFRRYEDKEWSFTDCTSKVVIEKLGLTRAFSFDHHFRQFGTVTVVP